MRIARKLNKLAGSLDGFRETQISESGLGQKALTVLGWSTHSELAS